MQKLLIAVTLTFSLLSPTAQTAEYNMRAGLWEVATTSDLLRLVPHIPAEQMKNINDLAKEYGFEMPQIEDGAAISKVCVTPEMASQKTLPTFYQDQAGCSSKKATRMGNNYQIAFTCDSTNLKGDGTADAQLTSAESFTGQTKFTGSAQGNLVNEKAEINGKWLGASCGEVKPM